MVYLHGLGHFHPENVIDNRFLEALDIGTSDEWIMERVGIRERRTVLTLDYIRATKNADPRMAADATLYSNADTGAAAARMAMQKAGIEASQIGMVFAGSCSPDHCIPAEASVIAEALGIAAPAVDVQTACSGFGAQLRLIDMMRPEETPEFMLLVLAENNTRSVDYRDRRTAVLWGDGTAAAVVSKRVPARGRVAYASLGSRPADWKKVSIPRFGHFVQEGPAVQTFAIKQTVTCFRELREKGGLPEGSWFIGHQANLTMLRSVCSRIGVTEDRHLFQVDQFGNTGAAGPPSLLSCHWDRFAAGDQLGMVTLGAGLTWAALRIEFGE